MKNFESLRDHVYNYICNKIQSGELRSGQKLNEAEICNDLSISRTPAREALIKLASDNLLEYKPRKGFTVKEITDKQKSDIYVIIAALDALAAELAVNNLTEEDFNKMNEIAEKIDVVIKYKNFKEYNSLQAEFHDVYIQKCYNEDLVKILYSLENSFVPVTYFSKDYDLLFPVLKNVNEDHRHIIELFEQKNIEVLSKFIKAHWQIKYPDLI